MSNSVRYDGWCIVTGQDFRQKFFIKDPTLPKIPNPKYNVRLGDSPHNSKEIYQPKDLTNYTAQMDIRESDSRSGTLLAHLEVGLGITLGTPDPADGSVELFIDNTVTNSQPFLDFTGNESFFDIFMAEAGGDTQRLFFGMIKIQGSITDV